VGIADRVIIVIAAPGAVAFAVALLANNMQLRSDTDAPSPAGVQQDIELPTATPSVRAIA